MANRLCGGSHFPSMIAISWVLAALACGPEAYVGESGELDAEARRKKADSGGPPGRGSAGGSDPGPAQGGASDGGEAPSGGADSGAGAGSQDGGTGGNGIDSGAPDAGRNGNPGPVGPGSRIPWGSGSWYLQGANVPWLSWGCDFGCGSGNGASSASAQATLGAAFASARAKGLRVLRWWVFPGDPWQINRDAQGTPTVLNPAVFADFDAALALGSTYDVYFDFVLFSAATAPPVGWITDAAKRAKLVAALTPLFARYSGNPRVLSWEIFNEPEFQIWNNQIAQAPVQATVKDLAQAIHANSTAYVTVGSAMLDGLSMWVGQGLDYYQAHWYDYMSSGGYCARCTDYPTEQAKYGLDKPLVIGEFYAAPDVDALARFEDFYAKGYAGAWAWSILSDKTSDRMQIDFAAASTFDSRHTDLGPR